MPSWIDRLLPWRKASTARMALAQRPGNPIWSKRDDEAFAREGYRKNLWVYACITQITKAVKTLPLAVERTTTRGDARLDDEHPILDLLREPNKLQGGGELFEAIAGFLLLTGNTYVESAGPRSGPPRELYALRPDRMRIEPDAQGFPGSYVYKVGNQTVRFSPRQVLHSKLWNPNDDWYGLSPLEAAGMSVDVHNEALSWNMSLLQNAGQPGGAWVVDSDRELSDTQHARMKRQVREEYGGAANAGKILLLEGGVDWKSMSLDANQLAWVEGLNLTAGQIVGAYGVPGELVGLKEATHENRDYARRTLYTEVVLPLVDHLLADLNVWLTPRFGDRLRLTYRSDRIDALGEDRDKLWNRVTKAWGIGLLKRNEARVELGFDEDPDEGDTYRTSGASAPSEPPTEGRALPAGRELRAFNLTDEDQKVAHWQQVKAAQDEWEATTRDVVKGIFQRERREVATLFDGAQDANSVIAALETRIDRDAWTQELTAANVATAEDFGRRVRQGLPKGVGAPETRQADSPFGGLHDETLSTLTATAGEHAKQVTGTTLAQLRTTLREGVDKGESVPRLAERVDNLYLEQIIPNRSTVIARTEVIGASNYGSHQAARGTGLPLDHEWITTRDGRERDTHASVDGQRVPIDQPFAVPRAGPLGGTESLKHPGDPSGSAGNVIQCRCTEAYHVRTGG